MQRMLLCALVFGLFVPLADMAEAQNCDRNRDHPKCQNPTPDPEPDPDPVVHTPSDDFVGPDMAEDDYVNTDDPALAAKVHPIYSWMHPDVALSFSLGYDGSGSHLVIVDNFEGSTYSGDLQDGTTQSLTHGEWTSLQAHLIAPGASLSEVSHPDFDFFGNIVPGTDSDIVSHFSGGGLQVVNLSFALVDPEGTDVFHPDYELGSTLWDSLVREAWNTSGEAVFIKAAGNASGGTVDGSFTIRTPRPVTYQDSLNLLLVGNDSSGAPNALFVGALDGNGTPESPATIASYSTIAGGDTRIQDMFLVVGVESGITNLAGTSFGAPIVSGYAAILGQKFDAAPAKIVDQLLATARTDTIADFGANNDCTATNGSICTRSSVYGVGEADLSRALAPASIPN